MVNRYSYFEENQALLSELKMLVNSHGNALVEHYLNHGFDDLAVKLGLFNDLQREFLFNYLMLDRKALLECVRRNKAFFLKLICEGKGNMIRPMLGIHSSRFDVLWRETLDLLSLYFAEKKVVEKMTNQELDKFLQQSIFKSEKNPDTFSD
jgi:hypothetical protein